jgi:hypothetical protein
MYRFPARLQGQYANDVLAVSPCPRFNCYNAELLLQRYKKHDGPDFPAFPKELFQEERDEQAVLATSASAGTIACDFMEELLRGMYCSTKRPGVY